MVTLAQRLDQAVVSNCVHTALSCVQPGLQFQPTGAHGRKGSSESGRKPRGARPQRGANGRCFLDRSATSATVEAAPRSRIAPSLLPSEGPDGKVGCVHPKTPDEIVAVVLLDIAVIVLAARGMGILARRVGQPAVVGEIVAGLVLGPSLLGQFPGNPSLGLFPLVVRPYLNVVAQIGLVIFMFIIGLELDLPWCGGASGWHRSSPSAPSPCRSPSVSVCRRSSTVTMIGRRQGRVVLAVRALHRSVDVDHRVSGARTDADRARHAAHRHRGARLACASVDDVLAWSILAVVVAVASSTGADPCAEARRRGRRSLSS